MSEQSSNQCPDLEGKSALVTGSSRGIGAEVAKLLAAQGATVVINYRQKAARAEKVVRAIEAEGGRALAVKADLAEPGDLHALAQQAVHTFGGIDILVLNASGGMESDKDPNYAYRLNRDAQLGMVHAVVPSMKPGSRIIFVTSHQAHFIDTVPTMPAYEPVARSKRAGEDALRGQIPALAEKGIDLVVVSGDMIEGTITATLLDRIEPGAIEARRAEAGRLYSVEEFAREVVRMVSAPVPTGHLELVGGAQCFLTHRPGANETE